MKVHLVDGTFELFRAHFSPRPGRTAPDGRDVKAAMGVVEQMITLLADESEAPTHLALAFDNPIRSFRNDLFDAYKSDEGVPEVLRAQFDLVEEGVRALGLTVWSMKEFEADDAIATATRLYAPVAEQIRILSPDKDFGQIISGTHVVMVDRVRRKFIDEEAVRKNFGVPPERIPDRLALTGDTADGIPGLPGFGEKTAAALLTAFGPLESIPDDSSKWPRSIRGADRLAPILTARRDDVLLYRKLATLRYDAPIPADVEAIRIGTIPGPDFEAFCRKLGAESVFERVRPR